MSLEGKPLELHTSDGVTLAADLYAAPTPKARVVIASAASVPRAFYRPFCAALVAQGFDVLAFDYRGLGGSAPRRLRGYRAFLHDWAERDLAAAIEHLEGLSPRLPTLAVAHSIGGQFLALCPPAHRLKGAVLVAAQSSYWKNWRGLSRAANFLLWYVGAPLLTHLLGYLPMKALWGGENLPKGVALEWGRWCRDPRYAKSHSAEAFDRFGVPMLAHAFTDDGLAPPRAVEHLLSLYTGTKAELRTVDPRAVGQQKLGHFGFFKEKSVSTLWPDVIAWLHART